jgi:hypothetical protein
MGHGFLKKLPHLKVITRKSQLKMGLCLSWRPTSRWAVPSPNSKLGRGTSVSSSNLGCKASPPNSKLGVGRFRSQLHVRSGRVRAQLHIGPGHVRAPPHAGSGMHPSPTPCWVRDAAVPNPVLAIVHWRLTILGCNHKLNPTPFRFSI